MLQTLHAKGRKGLTAYLMRWEKELKAAMFLTGARTIRRVAARTPHDSPKRMNRDHVRTTIRDPAAPGRSLPRIDGKARDSEDLRDACRYVLSGGGKRVRAILVLLSCEAVGAGRAMRSHAGAAVEIMHNFTLVHDDIMDNASSRSGRATVHVRWDLNTALLVGDVLLAMAYASLLKTRSGEHPSAHGDLHTGSARRCVKDRHWIWSSKTGHRSRVPDYFPMIEKKTGRLITVDPNWAE